MKLWFLRAVFWAWFITRGYYRWSKLWRWLFERRYRGQSMTSYAHIGQLEETLGRMRWKRDAGGGAIDVISSPEKVEAIWRATRADTVDGNEWIGDCDEFAQYAANRIVDLNMRGQFHGKAHFMSVTWFGDDGKFHGHNICAVELPEGGWAHLGNWFGGRMQKGFASAAAVAQWWADKDHGVLIAWALATPDLKLEKIQLG